MVDWEETLKIICPDFKNKEKRVSSMKVDLLDEDDMEEMPCSNCGKKVKKGCSPNPETDEEYARALMKNLLNLLCLLNEEPKTKPELMESGMFTSFY